MASIKLNQLESRILELEELASKIDELAIGLRDGKEVQPELLNSVQKWYRGARELLTQHHFSGLSEFDNCYQYHVGCGGRAFSDLEQYASKGVSPRNKFTDARQASDHYALPAMTTRFWRRLLI